MKTKHLTVMFTDIKNFTDRTSSQSRQELVKLLELHDTLIRPVFESFDGQIIKTVGDAFLVTFESPTDAVLCGMEIQKILKAHNNSADGNEQMEVRVAINSGEVTIKNDDIFGETVNIAARIENIAEPNEIYFTDAVYLSMNKNEIPSSEIGLRYLKGIPHEIKVYKVLQENSKKPKAKKSLLRPTTVRSSDPGSNKPFPMILVVIVVIVSIAGVIAFKYDDWFDVEGQSWETESVVSINAKETPLASANGKYSNLIQQFNCPDDNAGYGEHTDYGYWDGGSRCGQEVSSGYLVWVNPTWFVWERKEDLPRAQSEESESIEELVGETIESVDPLTREDQKVIMELVKKVNVEFQNLSPLRAIQYMKNAIVDIKTQKGMREFLDVSTKFLSQPIDSGSAEEMRGILLEVSKDRSVFKDIIFQEAVTSLKGESAEQAQNALVLLSQMDGFSVKALLAVFTTAFESGGEQLDSFVKTFPMLSPNLQEVLLQGLTKHFSCDSPSPDDHCEEILQL